MKNMYISFLVTLLITLLFSLTGNSLIIMYIILLVELYFMIREYKNTIKKTNKEKNTVSQLRKRESTE